MFIFNGHLYYFCCVFMKRRPTYLLLILLLFAKGYASATPANSLYLAKNGYEKIDQSNFHNAIDKEIIPQNISIIDDDNEEDDEYAPVVKQAMVETTISYNSLFAKGFLLQQFKNTGFASDLFSSWPPTYLRLRVIRI